MSFELKPHEIFRHPECKRTSEKILQQGSRVVVTGESGSGVSMFVKAHCDIYWNPTFSKYILLDEDTSTSEVFEENPGILEGSFHGLYIDLLHPWTKSVIKLFLKKIPSKTKVIIVTNIIEQDNDFIHVNTKNPNDTFEFLMKNQHFFMYFHSCNTFEFFKFFTKVNGKLSFIMQKYIYNSDIMDLNETSVNPLHITNIEESDHLFEIFEDVDSFFLNYGTLSQRLQLIETKSFCDIQINDIYGYYDITDNIRKKLSSYVWFQCCKMNTL
jgi:hypothetical protein